MYSSSQNKVYVAVVHKCYVGLDQNTIIKVILHYIIIAFLCSCVTIKHIIVTLFYDHYEYCRSGFDCEILSIANCEFFLNSQSKGLQVKEYTMNITCDHAPFAQVHAQMRFHLARVCIPVAL